MPAIDLSRLKRRIYWWDTVRVEPRGPLRGQQSADVVIVGAGFSGLWTAYQLKRADPSLDVAILEKDWAGAGASGHNDGFAIALVDLSLHSLVQNWGLERARAAHQAVATSVVEIGDFCLEHGIDANYRRPGFLAIARSVGEQARLEAEYQAAQLIGAEFDFEYFEGGRAREVLGSPAVRAALKEGRGAQLNPLALAQGIAHVIESLGVRIFEQSRVTEIVPGKQVIFRTEAGEVAAAHGVIATNASAWELPFFKRKVLPLWSYALVSAPLNQEQLDRVVWRDYIGYEDKRTFVSDGRLTPDNRFLCGGAEALYFFRNSMDGRHANALRPYEQLNRDALELFPMWNDIEWEYAYAGCMGMTPTFVPYFGSLNANLHYGLAYNGHGVAASHTGGQILCDLVLQRQSERTQLFFVSNKQPNWPPEPIRFVGARVTSKLVLRNDLALDNPRAARSLEPRILRLNKLFFRG